MNVKYPRFNKSKQALKAKNRDGIEIKNITLLMALGILADQFDFSADQLRDFMEDYNTLADSLAEKYDDFRKMEKALFDLYGLKIEETD